MGNRVNSTLGGVGSLRDVCDRWKEQLTCYIAARECMSDIVLGFESLLSSPETERCALSLAAAVLNSRFEKTGRIIMVLPDCDVKQQWHSDGADRQLLSDLLAD